MPGIRIKYVGPLDFKIFRDYTFTRCVTDDASGPTGTPGEMALEVPDNIANEALKHRDVFMQWHQAVPQAVKDLRLKRTEAMRRDGEAQVENWMKYVAVASMLPDDSERKKAIKANEMAGARAQVDVAKNRITQAFIERNRILREQFGENVPAELRWDDAGAAASNDLAAQYKEALENEATANKALRAELEALKAQMERDGRLTPDEEVSAPSVAEYGIDVTRSETEEVSEPLREEFPDVFEAEAAPAGAVRRPGRPRREA